MFAKIILHTGFAWTTLLEIVKEIELLYKVLKPLAHSLLYMGLTDHLSGEQVKLKFQQGMG